MLYNNIKYKAKKGAKMINVVIGAFIGLILGNALWTFLIEPKLKKIEERKTEEFISSLKHHQYDDET